MIRLLRLTPLLMGLLLLLTTLGTWVARAEKSSERAVVLVTGNPADGNQRLLQIWPGFRRPYVLTREPQRGTFGWVLDPANRLVQVVVIGGVGEGWRYYRINSSGRLLSPLIEVQDGLVVSSPDRQWMVAVLHTPVWEYWLIHVPTGRRWSIAELMGLSESHRAEFRTGYAFSNDSQWLYLIPQTAPYDLIRIRLVDRVVTKSADVFPDYPEIQAQIGDWLIMRRNQQFYRVRTDGTGFGPLLEGDGNDALFSVYPDDGVALIHRDKRMLAVDVGTWAILWEQTEFTLGFPPDGPPGWINIWQEDINLLLRVTTGETRALPAELQGPSTTRRTLFNNGRWALYSRSATGQEWWVYDWGSAKSRLLRQEMQYFRLVGVMPDEKWLLVENAVWPYGLYRLNLRDGTLEQMTTGGSFTWMGWTPPYLSTWQPLPLLFIGVLLMLFPFLCRLPRRWLKLTA
ncbi:MAG: hypothetical protein BroJett018_26210 [Chloroflexota bacterium]|nr:MAG: hypothetical protein BroJett018_26210 [Chloroflexota bacterium]